MASFWELHDLSALEYAPAPIGYSGADTGSGPPGTGGWVRTGYAYVGSPNSCSLWTSTGGLGKVAALTEPTSSDPASKVSPWSALNSNCSTPAQVWCIED